MVGSWNIYRKKIWGCFMQCKKKFFDFTSTARDMSSTYDPVFQPSGSDKIDPDWVRGPKTWPLDQVHYAEHGKHIHFFQIQNLEFFMRRDFEPHWVFLAPSRAPLRSILLEEKQLKKFQRRLDYLNLYYWIYL